jgi:hypothetical protein
MVFILPIEFRAPSKYEQEESIGEEYNEEELGEAIAQLAPSPNKLYLTSHLSIGT